MRRSSCSRSWMRCATAPGSRSPAAAPRKARTRCASRAAADALLTHQQVGDQAGGYRRQHEVTARVHPLVAVRRGVEPRIRLPVVHVVVAREVLPRQVATPLPAVRVLRLAVDIARLAVVARLVVHVARLVVRGCHLAVPVVVPVAIVVAAVLAVVALFGALVAVTVATAPILG